MTQLPAYSTGNALLNFRPLTDAIDTNNDNAFKAQGLALQQKSSDRADQELAMSAETHKAQLADMALAHEQTLGKVVGGIAQMVQQEPDAAKRAAMTNNIIAAHPEISPTLAKYGVDPADTDGALKFFAAHALGYHNPLDDQLKKVQIANIGSEIDARNKPTFTTIGHDAYGNASYGFADPRKMTVTPAQGGQQAAGTPPPGLTGEAYLATLDKPRADQVRALADGRMPYPSGQALKTPYWQQMTQAVSQFDPTFDAVNYNARAKTRADFTSGQSAKNIKSFNTAIGHLDVLDKAIDPLNNGAYPALNSVTQTAKIQGGDTAFQTAYSNFNIARIAVKEELTKAFKGTAGSLSEVEEWGKAIDTASSPQALHAAVKQAVNLLESRLTAVGDRYNTGMGTTKDPVELLSPHAQATFARLQGGGAAPAAASAPPAAQGPSKVLNWHPDTGLTEAH